MTVLMLQSMFLESLPSFSSQSCSLTVQVLSCLNIHLSHLRVKTWPWERQRPRLSVQMVCCTHL